jgi:tetratricopeptide (TPR) repeat protein
LIELGYIADPGDDEEAAIKNTVDENNFNLARAYLNGQQWSDGIQLLETLHRENPTVFRFASYLADAYQMVGKFKEARVVVDHICSLLDRENPQMDVLEGMLLFAEGRPLKALELFQKVEREAGNQPYLQLRIGNAYLQLDKLDKAADVLEAAVKADPEESGSWYSLGICRFRMAEYEPAMDALLHSIGLQYYHPPSHYYLGETLLAMQRYEEAANAYDVCLRLAPAMNMARDRLIGIYEHFLEQPGKANKYRLDFESSMKGEITIVSGLPRSGTSMMMQMMEAAGLEIFTDRERAADENNLKGYYEHEVVKHLAKDKSWLPLAKDKVVKVIAQLLPHLPMHYRYRIIYMERDILEVINSQKKMLMRNGKKVTTDTVSLKLFSSYENTIKRIKKWAETQPNVDIHFVNYASVIENPFMESMRINDFLDGRLDAESMAAAVDASMRRERIS